MASKITLYGIPNCDTVRKTRRWLKDANVAHHFHDFRKDGLDAPTLKQWVKAVGWEALLNRRGTTWRQLDASVRDSIDEASAIALMLEQPTLIKRPVITHDKAVRVGYDEAVLTTLKEHARA